MTKKKAEYRFDCLDQKTGEPRLVAPGETVHVDFYPQNVIRVETWIVDEGEEELELLNVRVHTEDVSPSPSPASPWPTCDVGSRISATLVNNSNSPAKFRSRLFGTEVV